MTKNYSLLLMTGAFLIASCNKSPAPPQSADTVAEADTTAVAASAPTESAAAAAAKAAHVIKPGKYRVCQDDGQSGHGDFVGSHLKVGQKVEIGEFGANATKVCFKKDCPPVGSDPPESEVKVMWLGGGENKLAGESTFDHKKRTGPEERRSHFVEIFNNPIDQGDVQFCTKKPNVLTINFCTVDEGEINCVGGDQPHLGHVHVEP